MGASWELHTKMGASWELHTKMGPRKGRDVVTPPDPWTNFGPLSDGCRPVFLKVGGIAPLGAILMGKGAKKSKGVKMLNH